MICSSPTVSADAHNPLEGSGLMIRQVCGDIHAENITITAPSGKTPYYACANVDTKLLDIPCRAG